MRKLPAILIFMVLVLMTLASTAHAQWQARHNLTPAQYQTTFDELFKQGYRMIHVSGYSSGGSAHFAAIWEKSSGPAWQAKNNLTFDQYQQAFTSLSSQGYRLKDISGYNVGGTDLYAAILEKT